MSQRRRTLTCALVLLALTLTAPALAQTGGYAIESFTVDGGGGTSSGGNFTLSGAIGQPEAGALAGGAFTLTGGFWGDAFSGSVKVYLPFIQR
ncbi:MAG: hypothetical protein ACT4QE_20495 [Anaerolineales bacterium]